ncbi:TonB-dependent receptor plug domain-containing protein [Xylella fastidiosa]|uniref:TonB-dependent receptor plug domain-containing protein n=1 Tax=Xylella fastidiosa TaxID=2371 RepID=UPI000570A462|nr:TonB-dependent receptor [Xylella fastidiosa]
MNPFVSLTVASVTALFVASPAFGEEATQSTTLDTMIVTGTHVTERTVVESESPIDIISAAHLAATGSSELATALSRMLPSLNFPRPALADGTSGIRPAQMRGLAPDQTLVLINGKRRHLSAQINVNGTIGRGSSAVDLNTIPITAIERIEVLRDGASAQYGSDAIAGVINIVLKGATQDGSLAVEHGQYSAGDGATSKLSGDSGISFANGRGTLHLAMDISQQEQTNRAGPYQGSAPNTGNYPDIGRTAFIYGDPRVNAAAFSANGMFHVGEHVKGYANAMLSNRDITSFAFYRSRNHNGQSMLLAQRYPEGYVPEIEQNSKDRSLVAGLKGSTEHGLNWDMSYNYGSNHIGFHTNNSINYSLGVESPRDFYDGALEYTQHLLNTDFTKVLDWGLTYPFTLSFGTEYRYEQWNQSPGIPASYNGMTGGAQGFAGFSPLNTVHANRNNYALYAGLDGDLSEHLSAGVAGRFEHYSDFGNQTSGKLSARYALTDQAALRATIGNGFRAPSLAQQRYQVVTSTYSNGTFYESGTFPTTSSVAQALGAAPLRAESSLSYSLGLVLQPFERLYLTLDTYQIDIAHRILLSSNLNDAAVLAALQQQGNSNVTSVRYFTNAANTRTRGVDLVGTYTIPFAVGQLDLTTSYSGIGTRIRSAVTQPAALSAIGSTQTIVGRDEIGRLEESFPKDKLILSGTWKLTQWDLMLAATRYGTVTVRNPTSVSRDQTYGARWVVDASASYKSDMHWMLTLGANNLLNAYPDKTVNAINSIYGQMPYSNYAPFGFNGTYVYARIGYSW